MTTFEPTCRQCFIHYGQSIKLVQKDGEWICPINPSHLTKDDVEVTG